jgi:hypothetical protein
MNAAGRFVEHIASRQYFLLFTFQLKAVFPFKDVAKNKTRMNMFGRRRARWEGQLKDGQLPAIEANWRKFTLVYGLYAGCGWRFRTIQYNQSHARQTSLKKLSTMLHEPRIVCIGMINRSILREIFIPIDKA